MIQRRNICLSTETLFDTTSETLFDTTSETLFDTTSRMLIPCYILAIVRHKKDFLNAIHDSFRPWNAVNPCCSKPH